MKTNFDLKWVLIWQFLSLGLTLKKKRTLSQLSKSEIEQKIFISKL